MDCKSLFVRSSFSSDTQKDYCCLLGSVHGEMERTVKLKRTRVVLFVLATCSAGVMGGMAQNDETTQLGLLSSFLSRKGNANNIAPSVIISYH